MGQRIADARDRSGYNEPVMKSPFPGFTPLIDRVYVAGGHDDIDYSKPVFPPLSQDDQLWVQQVIKKADRG